MSMWSLVAIGAGAAALTAILVMISPRALGSSDRWVVAALVVAGGVFGCLAPGSATGSSVLDTALRAVVGASFVVVASRVRAPVLLAAAAIVAVPSMFEAGGGVAAFVAVGVSVVVVATGSQGEVVRAAVGIAIGQAALRLEWPSTTRATAGLALLVFLVLAAPAFRSCAPNCRRRLLLTLAGLGALAVLAVGAYGVAVLSARSDLDAAVSASKEALAAVRNGDTATAASEFEVAEAAFARSHDHLDGILSVPVKFVPIAAQQARALERMSGMGQRLAAAGARVGRDADASAVTLSSGHVAIDKIRALVAPLEVADAALARARDQLQTTDSTWLLGPVSDKYDELTDQLTGAARDARTALVAARKAPSLLGADGVTRKYFVAFQTPAELRGNGGIIGSFAEISFTDGRLELLRSGRSDELNRAGLSERTLVGPVDYVRRYAQFTPEYVWQNVTMSPDFPSVAEVIENLYPQSGGEVIDGVISVDPIALQAFLRLTGPVAVPGLPFELTAQNAARYLLEDQYLAFTSRPERVDVLQDAVTAVISRLTMGNLPGPATIGEVLGPMARQGRLKIHSVHADENKLARRMHADGSLPKVRGDFIGVTNTNASGNKIDVFLHRSIQYDVDVNPATGEARATATITLRNDAPSEGLPDYVIAGSGARPTARGENRTYLSVYSPMQLEAATLDGRPLPMTTGRERSRNVMSAIVLVPPKSESTLRLELAGRIRLAEVGRDHGRYHLDVWRQPTTQPDDLDVSVVEGLAGSGATKNDRGASVLDWSGTVDESLELSATMR